MVFRALNFLCFSERHHIQKVTLTCCTNVHKHTSGDGKCQPTWSTGHPDTKENEEVLEVSRSSSHHLRDHSLQRAARLLALKKYSLSSLQKNSDSEAGPLHHVFRPVDANGGWREGGKSSWAGISCWLQKTHHRRRALIAAKPGLAAAPAQGEAQPHTACRKSHRPQLEGLPLLLVDVGYGHSLDSSYKSFPSSPHSFFQNKSKVILVPFTYIHEELKWSETLTDLSACIYTTLRLTQTKVEKFYSTL